MLGATSTPIARPAAKQATAHTGTPLELLCFAARNMTSDEVPRQIRSSTNRDRGVLLVRFNLKVWSRVTGFRRSPGR
jgi:hypothetical protein